MTTVLPIIGLVLFVYIAAHIGNEVPKHKTDVTCACGDHTATLIAVRQADAMLYACMLTDGCPQCRSRVALGLTKEDSIRAS